MAHLINLARTPARLLRPSVPVPVHLLAQGPAASPAHTFTFTATDAQLSADLDLAFARLISE
jgi:hypothetical protein